MQKSYLVVGVSLLLLTAGIGATGVLATPSLDGSDVAQTSNSSQAASCDYAALYDRTIDSVVAIRTNGGLGSGFVYQTAQGNNTSYVVTNAHVVGETGSVIVQFTPETSREGTVVGRDQLADLAVVRVNQTPESVEALSVADTPPDHGQKVAAIGTPFGLEETITHGIVSGLNRSMPTQMGFSVPDVIQTDAPINPGNSGGPLVACDGTVVGVNTAGISASRADNVGFAISASLVDRIVPALIRTGEYEHAYLGISAAPLTPQLVAANDLDNTNGVYVHDVAEGSAASSALQGTTEFVVVNQTRIPVGGDVILGIDGQPVNSGEDLSTYLVTESRPGEEVTLTILRDGEREEVTVTVGERPESPSQ